MGRPQALNPTEKIQITVDSELKVFLPKYLENRKSDLVKLRTALQAGDFQTLEMLSHRIKGHAKSYGFDGLSPICKKMELAAVNHMTESLAALLDEYQNYIDRVDIS